MLIEKEQHPFEKIASILGGVVAEKQVSDPRHALVLGVKLSEFVDLVVGWNRTHNITSKIYSKNDVWLSVLDSIYGGSYLRSNLCHAQAGGRKIIDAGAGGGVPGIPLAIVYERNGFHLVDTSRKKCSFLRFAKEKLKLDNVQVLNKDIQNVDPAPIVVTRAAFSPKNVFSLVDAVSSGGKIYIWSTPRMMEDFNREFTRLGFKLLDSYEYALWDQGNRALLGFYRP